MTAIAIGESKPVRLATLVLLICGLFLLPAFAAPQKPAHPSIQTFPAACYFFELYKNDDPNNPVMTTKTRDYLKSFAEVYRLWCKPNSSSLQIRMKAADAMAADWKLLWEDEKTDTIFFEQGGTDLLALMGITHQMPAPMVNDPKFTQMWMEACSETCFTLWGDLEKSAGQRDIIMTLRLRNDVLDNLKKEPASEPVLQMLRDARFRLVD
jgi:hypothetical protein